MNWQPIETAPKDGEFLVTGGVMNSELSSNIEYKIALVDDGFTVPHSEYYSVWIDNPTHWMPLPEPPA